MSKESLVAEVEKWVKERVAAMFCIPCSTEDYARELQTELKIYGFRSYVTRYGSDIELTLFLIDNKN